MQYIRNTYIFICRRLFLTLHNYFCAKVYTISIVLLLPSITIITFTIATYVQKYIFTLFYHRHVCNFSLQVIFLCFFFSFLFSFKTFLLHPEPQPSAGRDGQNSVVVPGFFKRFFQTTLAPLKSPISQMGKG